MATIQRPTPTPDYHDTARNEVFASADVQLKLIKRAGGDGKIETLLVMVFGEQEDGQPHVLIMADEAQLADQVKVNDTLRKQVVAFLDKDRKVGADEIPDTLSTGVDIDSLITPTSE